MINKTHKYQTQKVTGDKTIKRVGVTFLGIWNMVSVIIKPCINLLFLCMKSSVNSVMLPILSLPKSQPLEVIGQKINNSNFWLQSAETHTVYRSDVFFNVDLGF